MQQLLRTGQNFTTELSRLPCQVGPFLGGGGQGEVYKATMGSSTVALKWYFEKQATLEQRQALRRLVEQGPPTRQFLWPLDLVSDPAVPGYGYVMPLREPRYKGLLDLVMRKVESNFKALASAGMQLSHNFLELHVTKGSCYRDISFGNVFFEPSTGEVLICDNDNVTADGSSVGGVLGTPDFMAPEVVRGEANPSRATDLFSLAVLFFYMFFNSHPLYGRRLLGIRCLDLPAKTLLCGTKPLFIFDPDNRENEAVPLEEDPEGIGDAGANAVVLWPLYPAFFRDLFIEAFTTGLRDPSRRTQESIWRRAMARLRDLVILCAACNHQNLHDPAAPDTKNCWSCGQKLHRPICLTLGKDAVAISPDTRIFPHHINPQKPFDFSAPVGEVAQHPQNPAIWGLKNMTSAPWNVTMPDGSSRTVDPGRSVSLAPGVKIHFGLTDGTFVA
jgi:DNA-binding helix-hairpin-helix protein with protein kinase domain